MDEPSIDPTAPVMIGDSWVSGLGATAPEGQTFRHSARADELARLAYHTYGMVTDHKNSQGDPMPVFDDLPGRIRSAWRAVGARMFEEGVRFARTLGERSRAESP